MKKIVIFLSLLMSVSAFAQMREITGNQAAQVREAVRTALSGKSLSCQLVQGSSDLAQTASNSEAVKNLADMAIGRYSAVEAQDDGQPLLTFTSGYDGTVVKVSITSSEDRKEIVSLTYGVYSKIRVNSGGDLLNPNMVDGLQLNSQIQCQ